MLHIPGPYEELRAIDHLMRDGEQAGRELREKINRDLRTATEFRQALTRMQLGWLLTLNRATFYGMMANLEVRDAVEGWYEVFAVPEEDMADPFVQSLYPEGVRREKWFRVKEGGRRRFTEEELKALLPSYKINWVPGW